MILHGVLLFLACTAFVTAGMFLAAKAIQMAGGSFHEHLTFEAIGQVVAIIVGTVTLYLATQREAHKQRELTRREIYQRLELAAIDLFRFEAQHVELIRPLWEKDVAVPKTGTAEYVAFNNYVCQRLNLFEMIARFQREKIVSDEVFVSWLPWFYELCAAPGFQVIWKDLRAHYLTDLCEVMERGIEIASRQDQAAGWKEDAFKRSVEGVLGCRLQDGTPATRTRRLEPVPQGEVAA